MKFSDFKNDAAMLEYFGLHLVNKRFFDMEQIPPLQVPDYLIQDIDFVLEERGNTDKEFYLCEFLIAPLLKEAWKRNPKAKLFSHPRIAYEDLVLIPDYAVAPKNKTGLNIFEKPLLVTVEAKNDDYELGWSDVFKQLVVARLLNENDEIPVYAIVSIGKSWEFGKLEGKSIYKHPAAIGIDNANKILGVLDFIFADCVRTAEKFDMY